MKIQFKVKRKIHRDLKTNYTIFVAKVIKYEGHSEYPVSSEMIFKGNMFNFKVGDTYEADADVLMDRIRGAFIQIHSVKIEKLQYEEEIVNFIKKYSDGVPKKLIEPIVKEYGVNTIEVIGGIDGFNKIKTLNISGLGEKRIKKIREAVIYNKNYEEVMIFLELNNLPVKIAPQIVDNLGKEALIDLKANPYQLINHIDFKELDEIGYRYLKNPRMTERIVAGIISYINNDIKQNGNIYTEKEELLENLDLYMSNKSKYENFKCDDLIIKDAFDFIAEENLLKIVKEKDATYIYRKDMSFMEKRIAERVVELSEFRIDLATKMAILEEVEKYEKDNNIELDNHQIEAVVSVLQSNLSVLSGGPGTGKTFTTNLIKTIYRVLNPDAKILLLAPTGKAAKRLSELCGEEAMTIHRGLNIRPLEQIDDAEELEADFIIIDEASMIDLQMLYNLLSKIKEDTKVLFVGDYQQLPSVGAGLVLRDLMQCGQLNVVKLEKIFRQALTSNIVLNSHKMIAGDLKDYVFEKDTFLLENKNILNYYTRIMQIIKKAEENNYSIDDIVVLSPTKKGDLGTRTLNIMIQQEWNKNNNPEDIFKVSDTNIFKVGDKVIHTKNNYEANVFNGEIGIVVGVTRKMNKNGVMMGDTLYVSYEGRIVEYKREMVVEELELAYALTIHKSQGSEYPIVINVVSNIHQYMLNRNLVYTAWTRAKERLYVLGNQEAVSIAASKNSIVNRKSRLAKLICDLAPEEIF